MAAKDDATILFAATILTAPTVHDGLDDCEVRGDDSLDDVCVHVVRDGLDDSDVVDVCKRTLLDQRRSQRHSNLLFFT
jgi:hypothetical protein